MSDSPAAILFDVNGNPVGTVIDGVFYRLQVEAKLAAGTNTVGKVDQGAPGATPWPVTAGTLPLPTGAATEATLNSVNSKLNSLGQKTMANSVPVVFASDQTVDVSSTELSLAINDFEVPGFSTQVSGSDDGYARVIAVDGYGRQIVVGAGTAGNPVGGVISVQEVNYRNILGEYFASTNLLTGAGVSQNILTITNPNGSGRSIYLNRIETRGYASGNSSIDFMYKLFRASSTPTGGTVLSFQKRNTADFNSIATLRTLSTVTTSAGILWATSPGHTQRPVEIDFSIFTESDKNEIVINQNESIVISVDANSSVWKHWANISWYEV